MPRTLLTALCPALLLTLAACTQSTSPSQDNGSDGGTPATLDQSSLPRTAASSIPGSVLTGAVTANNAFAFDLYGRVRTSPSAGTGNVLTSPLSASLALTMTYAGAQGDTATQMATALHYGSSAASIFDGQNALTQALGSRAAAALAQDTQTASQTSGQAAPSPSDYSLQVVNSVWGEKTYPWEQPFLDILAQSYGTGVYLEDFVTQWDPARQAINAWVSTQTSDKIENLLPDGSLDDTTRMVLVNAIHLKLPWATPFKVSATASGTFTKADGSTVSASFMNQAGSMQYADDGQAQIVSLPLSGGDLNVVIALPHGDLATYEAGLTAANPGALAPPVTESDVELSLPKVTFTSPTFSLKTELQAMGMVQPFDAASANFTGLCANPPDGGNLYIADVLQKDMLAMQETGVEAAAATAVLVDAGGAAEQPVPMVVNRPYVVAIVDVPTGAILFLGHIEDPTATGGQ
jgi:serpin B